MNLNAQEIIMNSYSSYELKQSGKKRNSKDSNPKLHAHETTTVATRLPSGMKERVEPNVLLVPADDYNIRCYTSISIYFLIDFRPSTLIIDYN